MAMSYVKQILEGPLCIDNVDKNMLKWTNDGKGFFFFFGFINRI